MPTTPPSAPSTAVVAVTSPSFSSNPVLKDELTRSFPRARLNVEGRRYKDGQLLAYLQDCDGVVVGLERIDQTVLSACPRLRIVAKYGVGLDNIDLLACQTRGVTVGWTGGVNRVSVAELTVGFMLALAHNVPATSTQLRGGRWNKSGGFQLSGKTVGIIGVGHVGKELVRLLKPFGCRILGNDILDLSAYYAGNGIQAVDKDRLFAESDVITLHVPLTDATSHLIRRETLSRMRPTALLVNTSRGGIVREEDLKWALTEGIIAGAALDVYESEPPGDLTLLSLPQLLCTPHIAGNTFEAVVAMGRSAIAHLEQFFLR